MVKMCDSCLNMFKRNVEVCTILDCRGEDLVEIDDHIADAIHRLSGLRRVLVLASCAGHLYKLYFSPYVRCGVSQRYYETGESKLDEIREVFMSTNNNRVDVGEIEEFELRGRVYSSFTVNAIGNEWDEYRDRLSSQRKFIDTLYDAIEYIETT